jgi:hypothetical protein
MATTKSAFGKACECLVQEIIKAKTGYAVNNLNDKKNNHPYTDLEVINPKGDVIYEVSVKTKDGREWPSVKGIVRKDQYIVFVDFYGRTYPDFYVLSCRQWNNLLKKILPSRGKGAKIVNGSIEWNNCIKSGKETKRKGSLLRPEEIAIYKDKLSSLPGVV